VSSPAAAPELPVSPHFREREAGAPQRLKVQAQRLGSLPRQELLAGQASKVDERQPPHRLQSQAVCIDSPIAVGVQQGTGQFPVLQVDWPAVLLDRLELEAEKGNYESP